MGKSGSDLLWVQRGQDSTQVLTPATGEAGDGIYAYFPRSVAMRRYYADHRTAWDIGLAPSRVVDLTEPANMETLLAFAKDEFAKLKRVMPGYIMPKVSRNNIQRFGRVVTQFVAQNHPWAGAWVVPHQGPGVPTSKQVVIADESAIVKAHPRFKDHPVTGQSQSFQKAIRPFRDQIYQAIIDAADCGPFDGGCVVFANALQSVIGGDVVVVTRTGSNAADHAAVRLNGVLCDFDGPLPPAAFLRRFANNEHVDVDSYRPIADGDLPDACHDTALQDQLCALLGQALGVNNEQVQQDSEEAKSAPQPGF